MAKKRNVQPDECGWINNAIFRTKADRGNGRVIQDTEIKAHLEEERVYGQIYPKPEHFVQNVRSRLKQILIEHLEGPIPDSRASDLMGAGEMVRWLDFGDGLKAYKQEKLEVGSVESQQFLDAVEAIEQARYLAHAIKIHDYRDHFLLTCAYRIGELFAWIEVRPSEPMVATRKSQIDHIVNFNQRRMPKDERRSNAQQAIKETKRQYLHRAGDTGFIKKKAAATLKISVRTLNRWLEE